MPFFLDFSPIVAGTVNFTFSPGGQERLCTDISILDDEVFEALDPESFSVELAFPGFERVTIDPSVTQVFIDDNEGICW